MIEARSGDATVQEIQQGVSDGETIYSVSIVQTNGTSKVIVNSDGVEVTTPEPSPSEQPVVAPVPEPVASTNELPEGITREIVGGRVVYNVESENSQIRITPRAQVLSATDSTSMQMDKIPWDALPPVVQNAVLSQTGPGQILDITRGTYYGQSVYEIIYQQNDQRTQLRLYENGAVLSQGIISTEDSRSIAVEPFIGAQNVPVAVMTTLRVAAGDSPIESVQQEIVNGRVTYVGVFRENGQPVTLRLSQEGRVLER